MGEIRSVVIGVMLFSLIVTAIYLFDSDLATNSSVTMSQNLSNSPALQQLASMNGQLTDVANQTAQVNYNSQGALGSFGFLAIIPTGFLIQLQQIWIIASNGLNFIILGITSFIPLPGFVVAGLLAMASAYLLISFIGLILGRNI